MQVRKQTVIVGATLIVMVTTLLAVAQKQVDVKFEGGSNQATYSNQTLTGDQSVDYDVQVQAGQTLSVKLSSSNRFLYFNVLDWGGSGEAISNDAREVTTYTGKVPKDGSYRISVYLVRAEARRNTRPVQFNLNISLKNEGGGGGNQDKVKLDDLKGVRASSGESEMATRGFRNVDALKSGNTSYTIWWNGRTRQCIQVATADGRYDSLTDIQTHPKCNDDAASGDASSQPVEVSDLVGARASSGETEFEARGFRNVDGGQSGNGKFTVWFNKRTRQCIQAITVNGKYDSVTDIQTHPKCK